VQSAFCKSLSESLKEMYNTFYALKGSAVRTSHRGEISHFTFPYLKQYFLYCNLHYLTIRVSFQLEIQAPSVAGKEKPTLAARTV